jgi:predicted transcriptional regulator
MNRATDPADAIDAGLGDVLIEIERELRQLVWRADQLQETLGELVAKAGERLDDAAIEEAQSIDYISQRLTRIARTVGQVANALGGATSSLSVERTLAAPGAGEFEAF